MLLRNAINSALDSMARPELHLLHRPWPAFQVWVGAGFIIAVLTAISLSFYVGISPAIMAVLAMVALLSIFSLGMVTKIITGEEQHVHYHHAIAIAGATTLLVWLLGRPILPYLDLAVLGIGVFVVVGRMGCFMVGCCHGRPHRWGVCYRQEHADAGLVPYYVGVRLFPVQLAESLWTLMIVSVGVLLILERKPHGTFLAWYVVSYCLGRFFLEFWRGDPERPYLGGYSEAQWTSFALIGLLVWAEYSGIVPLHTWHSVAFAGLLVAMIGIALKRSFQSTTARQLLNPLHIQEVAEALEFVTNQATELGPDYNWPVAPERSSVPQQIHIACTSSGVQVSASNIKDVHDQIHHYAISHRDGRMTEETAKPIAKLILELRRVKGSSELLAGSNGVFHLLIRCPGENRLAH